MLAGTFCPAESQIRTLTEPANLNGLFIFALVDADANGRPVEYALLK
jgi:hypothetical protein